MAFNPGQIEHLWVQYGGNPRAAPMAAAIAMAESSGNPSATNRNTNGSIDRGLFQINSIHGGQSTYDLAGNIRAAIAISGNGSNWQPWSTFGNGAYRQYLGGASASAPTNSSGGAPAQPPGTTSIPVTTTSFDQAGYKQAQQRQLLAQFVSQKSPWDIPVKGASDFGGPNPLFASGLLSKQAPNPSDFQHSQTTLHQIATGSLQGMSGQSLVNVHAGAKGYVNPIPGAVIGRTDQGVDASMRPGSPIRALGDSRVVQIVSWYRGQPLVLMQLTSGSHAGQYWYVAEQIAPSVRVGQSVRAGQVIGTYASSGTGLELGWGSPSTPHLTLATAPGHGGYTEGQVTPEGANFRSFLGSL